MRRSRKREGFLSEIMLYQKIIIEHSKAPRNFGALKHSTHSAEEYNPVCGDHLIVYLRVDANNLIKDISFQGDSCAIAKASASMMTVLVKGKSFQDAKSLFVDFQKLVVGDLAPEDANHLGELSVFSDMGKHPSRLKCAQLPWLALKQAVNDHHPTA